MCVYPLAKVSKPRVYQEASVVHNLRKGVIEEMCGLHHMYAWTMERMDGLISAALEKLQ